MSIYGISFYSLTMPSGRFGLRRRPPRIFVVGATATHHDIKRPVSASTAGSQAVRDQRIALDWSVIPEYDTDWVSYAPRSEQGARRLTLGGSDGRLRAESEGCPVRVAVQMGTREPVEQDAEEVDATAAEEARGDTASSLTKMLHILDLFTPATPI